MLYHTALFFLVKLARGILALLWYWTLTCSWFSRVSSAIFRLRFRDCDSMCVALVPSLPLAPSSLSCMTFCPRGRRGERRKKGEKSSLVSGRRRRGLRSVGGDFRRRRRDRSKFHCGTIAVGFPHTHTQEEEEEKKKCTHSVVGRKKGSWKGTRNLHFSLPTRLEKRGF